MALKEVIKEKIQHEEEFSVKEQTLTPDPHNGQYYFDGEADIDNEHLQTPILEVDIVDHDTIRITGEKSDGRVMRTIFSREQINSARIQGKSARDTQINLVWFDPYQPA